MGIEFGSIGSAIGNIAGSLGKAGGAVEAGGGIGAPALSLAGPSVAVGIEDGFAEFGELSQFQAKGPDAFGPEVQALSEPPSNDILGSISFLKDSVPVYTRPSDPMAEAAGAEAEAIIAEAWKHPVLEQNPLNKAEVLAEANHWLGINDAIPDVIPANAGIQLSKRSEDNSLSLLINAGSGLDPRRSLPRTQIRGGDDKKMKPQILLQTESVIRSAAVPDELEYPRFQPVVSPALEPATQTKKAVAVQTATRLEEEVKESVSIQPALQEEMEEEVVTEKIVQKQSEIIDEEEEEESKLKDVVDQEVLGNRTAEFEGYVEKADAQLRAEALERGQYEDEQDIEIDGERIVSFVSPENEDKRCGLVKKTGPDGSRVEAIEEIASKRFRSIKEAKDYVVATIIRKVPVKKAIEGQEAGRKDVARVLKYLFTKEQPHAQTAAKIIKRRQLKAKGGGSLQVAFIPEESQLKSTEPKIEDYPVLEEVFQKAA
ncbi:MAG: hypothetical protein Q8Q15_01375 [bacterium]|nr:hypothetical protein [bacterium]